MPQVLHTLSALSAAAALGCARDVGERCSGTRGAHARRNRRQVLQPDPSVGRLLMFVAAQVTPQGRRPSLKMWSFRQIRISKTPVSSLSGSKRAVACCHARHGFPGRRRAKLGIGLSVVVSQVSSDLERDSGKNRARVRDACMLLACML